MRIIGKGKTARAIKERFGGSWFDDDDCENFDIDSIEPTVISPGVPPHHTIVANTKTPISDLDIVSPPYSIWISGTNGKTTTTSMIALLLENMGAVCGGNIGTPVVKLDEKAHIWVLEVSSFTLHYTTKASPDIYLLLPITLDHISWHSSFELYESAKLSPLQTMGEQSIVILPESYRHIDTKANTIYYKETKELACRYGIDTDKINFTEPFLFDGVVSLIVAGLVGKKPDYELLNSFIQDSHKLEQITDSRGRVWIDDSKATNIDATIQAIKPHREKKIFLILGGDDKDVDMTELFEFLRQFDVAVFCIGQSGQNIDNQLKKREINSTYTETIQETIAHIDRLYRGKNSIAILSPACASFDQFNSYSHRGDEFKKLVFGIK